MTEADGLLVAGHFEIAQALCLLAVNGAGVSHSAFPISRRGTAGCSYFLIIESSLFGELETERGDGDLPINWVFVPEATGRKGDLTGREMMRDALCIDVGAG